MKFQCLLITFFLSFDCLAQQVPCGFDALRAKDETVLQKEAVINNILYDQALAAKLQAKTTLTIPVVVHIIHQNGPENIADSTVINVLDEANLRFANAAPFYDSSGVDVQIQFCLASVDPWGNPTTGITRTVSSYTNLGSSPAATELNMKNLSRWEPHLYMNIWVVANTGVGFSGFAYFPSAAGNAFDGIVIEANSFISTLIAHEIGHYLGLYHTFEGGCPNMNCLLEGDKVCDTPPDSSNSNQVCLFNSCSTEMSDTSGFNPFTGNENDLPNYMDYTVCPLSFTAGQADRMYNALTQIRSTLTLSNGCGQNPGGSIPVASFTIGSPNCYSYPLTNTSMNSVGALWDLDGDGDIDNSGNVINHKFPYTGNHTVTIYASGYGGMDTLTQVVFAQSAPDEYYPIMDPLNSGFGLSLITETFVVCQGNTLTFNGAPGMVSYLWSTGDTTPSISFAPTSYVPISLTAVDNTGLTWTSCFNHPWSVVPAAVPPTLTPINNDTAYCLGDTITLIATYTPLLLFSNWYTSSQGVLVNFKDTIYQTTAALFNTFFINQTDSNGCSAQSAVLDFMGDYHALQGSISQNGNVLTYVGSFAQHYRWYRNGVAIPNSDTSSIVMDQTGCYTFKSWYVHEECGTFSGDTVCTVISGIVNVENGNQFNLYPNPVSSELNIHFISGREEIIKVKLYDAVGRVVKEIKLVTDAGSNIHQIDISALHPGIYFVELKTGDEVINRKIVVE